MHRTVFCFVLIELYLFLILSLDCDKNMEAIFLNIRASVKSQKPELLS